MNFSAEDHASHGADFPLDEEHCGMDDEKGASDSDSSLLCLRGHGTPDLAALARRKCSR
jgi:hypothetical protein